MRILVNVKPGAGVNKIEEIEPGTYKVFLKEKPVGGKANQALIKFLADHFNTSQNKIRICSGFTAHSKIIEVGD